MVGWQRFSKLLDQFFFSFIFRVFHRCRPFSIFYTDWRLDKKMIWRMKMALVIRCAIVKKMKSNPTNQPTRCQYWITIICRSFGPIVIPCISVYECGLVCIQEKKVSVLCWPGLRLLMSVFVISSNSYFSSVFFSLVFFCLGHIIQIWNIQISNMIRGRRFKASHYVLNSQLNLYSYKLAVSNKGPRKKIMYD